MKNTVSFFFYLVLLCNSALLMGQTEPEEIKSESDIFQDSFYESLLQKGIENYDKALVALEICAKNKPNDAVVYFEMGKNYLALKEYNKAYQSFEKATQIDPTNKWFWLGMYDVNYETKTYDQAIVAVQKLIEFDPIYKEDLVSLYMYTQQYDKALALINELNDTIGKSLKRDAYKMQIVSQGKFQNVEIKNLLQQIDKNPKVESNYVDLIRLYSDNNETDKALQITKKLETEIPTSVWAQVTLFKHYLEINEGEKAVLSMNDVLESPAIDTKIKHRVLNEFLIYVNSNPKYEAELEKAVSFFDNDTEVNVSKEIAKYYHSKKQWEMAIRYYELTINNSAESDVDTYLLLLQSYAATKQFELVVKKATSWIDSYPTQPKLYYYAGMANNQLQQFKKAKELLEMGMDYVVEDVDLEINFNLQLAETANGLGDSKKKEMYFDKANQLLIK